jgi:Domain of unknown function (DUF4382)
MFITNTNQYAKRHGFFSLPKNNSMKTTTISFLSVLAAVLISVVACQKDSNSDSTTNLQIHLTDNPFNATEVNVDIREIKVNLNDDSTGWVSLNTNAGIYNLLALQNGVDTLLATGTIPTGTLKEVRFVLGNDNSIKIGTVTYPLTIPSGSESGLKIKLNKKLNASIDSLLIDFDAALSIMVTGNGEYKLKPVLKIK